ncbi:MAG: diaminopimelate decarboxylase [Deltaproteobacteria bacterium]|jgi:diaminopimelate decarboxylase|nr:diaminopimelate decarboxylase [Deltaproteobacteria bacterium]
MPAIRSAYTDSLRFFGGKTPRQLAADYGSPLYVYNENVLRRSCREMLALSAHPGFRVNYSAKANSNPSLLRIIREEGCLADAMSPGELHMNLHAGFSREQLLYVCNNVSEAELKNAADHGLLVSVDSLAQLDLYGRVNRGGKVMLRFNPGIGAGHHQKVVTAGKSTKFGIAPGELDEARALLAGHQLALAGLNQHIGSLFMAPEGYLDAMDWLLAFAAALRPEELARLEVLDFGGGFGIPYRKYENEARLDLAALGRGIHERISAFAAQTGYQGLFYVEPGRYIVAECGLLLGTVHAVKSNAGRRYVGTDLGFNTLMRPVLYNSHHDVEIYRTGGNGDAVTLPQTVVGNICESGDILADSRELPEIRSGDILGVLDAGAYGFAMCSNYNLRLRPAELLVCADGACRVIRRRDSLDDLLRNTDV